MGAGVLVLRKGVWSGMQGAGSCILEYIMFIQHLSNLTSRSNMLLVMFEPLGDLEAALCCRTQLRNLV